MNTQQLFVDFPEVQGDVYRLALSLDSFLLNGIQYGVLQRVAADGFLEETASSLLSDLARLEEQALNVPVNSQPTIAELLASLRAKCQQLVELVMGLRSFRTLPLDQVRQAVSQIAILRQACVQAIQELEVCLGTPKPFYPSRSAYSTTAVNDFLATLEQLFVEVWNASR